MKHEVKLQTSCLHVQRSGLELSITQDGACFGTIKTSDGKIEWCPKDEQNGIGLSRNQFDDMMKTMK